MRSSRALAPSFRSRRERPPHGRSPSPGSSAIRSMNQDWSLPSRPESASEGTCNQRTAWIHTLQHWQLRRSESSWHSLHAGTSRPPKSDAVNAFPNAHLDEEIFVHLPEGFQTKGILARLLKALYGLRRSPLLWQSLLTSILVKLGLKPVPGRTLHCDE